MRITGRMQREGQVIHVVADRIEDLSDMLDLLDDADALNPAPAHADEIGNAARTSAPGEPRPGHLPPPKLRRHPREQAKGLFRSRDFH